MAKLAAQRKLKNGLFHARYSYSRASMQELKTKNSPARKLVASEHRKGRRGRGGAKSYRNFLKKWGS